MIDIDIDTDITAVTSDYSFLHSVLLSALCHVAFC